MQIKTILVTGGAGFIGSNLCDQLLENGQNVVCIDNLDDYYSPKQKLLNLTFALKSNNFVFEKIDICNFKKINELIQSLKPDCVIHLAAKAGVQPSLVNPLIYEKTNISGTNNILETIRVNKISQFIFASSSSVYGLNNPVPFNENDSCDFPISPYAMTKRACEIMCYTYSKTFGIRSTVLRFFNAYGPRNRPDMAIYKFTKLILKNEPIIIYKNAKRDFTFVSDIVSGIIAAINNPFDFEIINLGNNTPILINTYIETLEKEIGRSAIRIYNNLPLGEMKETMADILKAKRLLNFSPKISLDKGIHEFYEWYKTTQT